VPTHSHSPHLFTALLHCFHRGRPNLRRAVPLTNLQPCDVIACTHDIRIELHIIRVPCHAATRISPLLCWLATHSALDQSQIGAYNVICLSVFRHLSPSVATTGGRGNEARRPSHTPLRAMSGRVARYTWNNRAVVARLASGEAPVVVCYSGRR
jgi:hypothetical protein